MASGTYSRRFPPRRTDPIYGGTYTIPMDDIEGGRVSSKQDLLDRVERLRREAERLEIEAATMLDLPKRDPFKNGDCIKFVLQYNSSEKHYTYHAFKADELWYTTSRRWPQGLTWYGLTCEIQGNDRRLVGDIMQVSIYKKVKF
jgi:hypothetical protein